MSLQGCTRSTASSAGGLAGQGLQHGHHGAASPPHPADPVMLQIVISDFSLAQAAKTGIPNTLIFSNNMFSPLIAGDDIFISIVQSRRFFIMESVFGKRFFLFLLRTSPSLSALQRRIAESTLLGFSPLGLNIMSASVSLII